MHLNVNVYQMADVVEQRLHGFRFPDIGTFDRKNDRMVEVVIV